MKKIDAAIIILSFILFFCIGYLVCTYVRSIDLSNDVINVYPNGTITGVAGGKS